MTQVPSEAAKRKACELANAAYRERVAGSPKYDWDEWGGRECDSIYALALHLDEVDRVARDVDASIGKATGQTDLRLHSLMLPDEPDELDELFGKAVALGKEGLRLALIKSGLKLVKERP